MQFCYAKKDFSLKDLNSVISQLKFNCKKISTYTDFLLDQAIFCVSNMDDRTDLSCLLSGVLKVYTLSFRPVLFTLWRAESVHTVVQTCLSSVCPVEC